jgi:heme oxygenase
MTTLKELTREKHELAEAHPFMKLLLTGDMPENVYADYLFNQLAIYVSLERIAQTRGLLEDLPNIGRSTKMGDDFDKLSQKDTVKVYPSTQAYLDYINKLDLTDKQILAHIYVRHMGDMYGGQMIKSLVPGISKTMYEFENRSELIKKLSDKLDTSMAAEANYCFSAAIDLFTELADEHNIQ